MPEAIDSVNSIAEFFRQAAKDDPRWATKFTAYANQLDRAKGELVRLYGLTSALPPDLGNIFDLPPEVRAELLVKAGDSLDNQIVTVVNCYEGCATLDQIIVGLSRKFGVAHKRRFLQNKLYRMTTVWASHGKKGSFTTIPENAASPDDIASMMRPLAPITTDYLEDEIPV